MAQALARPPLHRAGQEHARRQPEQTVLYQVVSTYWSEFVERAQEHGGLPKFVAREVEAYLECGLLEQGCIEVACTRCGFTHVVAFSCKRRGFCPSCCGRRMNDTAAFLVDRVLPSHPIRQWVCTLPFSLRYLVGYHAGLCGAIADAFAKELMKSYQRRAKRALGHRLRTQAKTGTVTFVQRFDSALRLSPHMHVLTVDGVYVRAKDGALEFHPLAEPTLLEVGEVAARTAARAARVLRRHGRLLCEGEGAVDDELSEAEPVLSSCYRAATNGQQLLDEEPGQPVLRVIVPARSRPVQAGKLVAEVSGFNVHAQRVVDGRDRAQVERLCRYLARPPVAHERLQLRADGRVRLELKTAWSDGTTALVLSALDLLSRLCGLVPPPRFHLTRFHGVFAQAAKLRKEVVPQQAVILAGEPSSSPLQLVLFGGAAQGVEVEQSGTSQQATQGCRAGRHPWSWLMKRVFDKDLSVCPRCSGRMSLREVAVTPEAITRVLARHELWPRPPPPAPVRRWVAPSQVALRFT